MYQDITNYDRYLIVEVKEINGSMEYQDRNLVCIPAGESQQRSLEKAHLGWRGTLDEDIVAAIGTEDGDYDCWGDYYATHIITSCGGAIWSDTSLIEFPDVIREVSKVDAEQYERMCSHGTDADLTAESSIAIAEQYIKQAAEYLAIEKGIPFDFAHEEVLAHIALPR